MSEQAATVVIHDDLRAMFRARQGRELSGVRAAAVEDPRPTTMAETSTDAATHAEAPATMPADPAPLSLGPTASFRLRCDGRRPVAFDGVVLLERSVETDLSEGHGPVRQEFSLYLSTEGKIYARIAMLLPEGMMACPLHKVASLDSALGLEAFFKTYDPAEGWSWLAFDATRSSGRWTKLIAAVRHDFRNLVRAALGAAPIQIQS